MIQVTKEIYKDSLKVNHKYCANKISIIIICIMFVITRIMNTMSAETEHSTIQQDQKPISSHNQQFIRYCTNFIMYYCNYYTSTGSPCISKHFRSTKCTIIKIITYNYNILYILRFKLSIISDYFYYRKVSYFMYLFHFMKNLVKLCAIILDYFRINLFIIIVIHISQTSRNNFLDTKPNLSLLSLTNFCMAANINKSIICFQSQNVYIKLIERLMSNKRLAMSKILQVCIYHNYICGNLLITSNMCVVHSIILIYNKNNNTRGP